MEFQPVVMAAGRGSRMVDLTTNKANPLLPIGNKPMLWYPLNMLEKAGFESAIVVILESIRGDLIQALRSAGTLNIHVDYETIPDDEDWGTADTLRHIAPKIKTDVLVVSCDLITDVELHLLADMHRVHDSTITALMLSPSEQSAETVSVPGPKSKRKQEQKDIVGISVEGNRLLMLTAEADVEDSLSIDTSLLKRYPYFEIRTNLMDAHLYILKKWVVEFLDTKAGRSLTTIKGEVIPYFVKKQFKRSQPSIPPKSDDDAEDVKEKQKDIYSFTEADELRKVVNRLSSWRAPTHYWGEKECEDDRIGCYAFISQGGFCIRANTMAAYCEANRQIAARNEERVDVNIPSKSQVGPDSMVGSGSSIGEKVSIKKSTIGQHCVIKDRVKITNSVVMDHVTIHEGCMIHGSVICGNAHINEGVELKDCVVGDSQSLAEKTKLNNEVVGDSERMMEI